VAAAATTQVKLCPYEEEEPHIWFRLIEAQFADVCVKSQKLKYAFRAFWTQLTSAMILISLLII
jgi:hypothetical protein